VSTFWVIFGMGIVTFLPRMLPVLVGQQIKFPLWLQQWLSYIPYAVLGALIFPGILSVDPSRPWIGLVGGIAAVLIALTVNNVIVIVIGSIVVLFFFQ
jgi:branched-subunit amino acid transport protein